MYSLLSTLASPSACTTLNLFLSSFPAEASPPGPTFFLLRVEAATATAESFSSDLSLGHNSIELEGRAGYNDTLETRKRVLSVSICHSNHIKRPFQNSTVKIVIVSGLRVTLDSVIVNIANPFEIFLFVNLFERGFE